MIQAVTAKQYEEIRRQFALNYPVQGLSIPASEAAQILDESDLPEDMDMNTDFDNLPVPDQIVIVQRAVAKLQFQYADAMMRAGGYMTFS